MQKAPVKSDPLWQPDANRVEQGAMTQFRIWVNNRLGLSLENYDQLYQWSITSIPEFWEAVWEFTSIKSSTPNHSIVENLEQFPGATWFPGARLNFAENLLAHRDSELVDNGLALVSLLENGARETYSYQELYLAVEKLAAALKSNGVGVGDRVAGLMPNVSETVIAMLATTAIGAVWSSCSPDFGIKGALDRLGQIEPKVLFVTDGYFYNGKKIDCEDKVKTISEGINSLKRVVVVPILSRTPHGQEETNRSSLAEEDGRGLFIAYEVFIDACLEGQGIQRLQFEQLPFDHPVYIMYSSGTTGKPKCIVHGAGGTLLQHKKELMLHTDVSRDDVLFYFTTCGWMMWNWLVSGLSTGCTVVLYDGSPFAADGKFLLDAIDNEKISIFGCGAKYIASLEKAGIKPAETHDLSSLKTILSTGSPLSVNGFEYVYRDFKADVCLSSICGGTDIISCFMLGNPDLPVYSGEIQCRGLGMAVEFWDDSGNAIEGQKGELVCVKPFPSTPISFWNDPADEKFLSSYFSAYKNIWAHGDYGEITTTGGVVIHGRSDAVLNPGGVRIGTAEIYRQVEKLDEVVDSVVVGQQWEGDERVVLFVVMKEGCSLTEAMIKTIKQTILSNTTPRHVPAKIIAVDDIPRTISGKTVELAVKNVISGDPVKNVEALANPQALENFKDIEDLVC